MTKKHFVALAEYMLANRSLYKSNNTYIMACYRMADVCAENGANFNRTKFLNVVFTADYDRK